MVGRDAVHDERMFAVLRGDLHAQLHVSAFVFVGKHFPNVVQERSKVKRFPLVHMRAYMARGVANRFTGVRCVEARNAGGRPGIMEGVGSGIIKNNRANPTLTG